MRVKIFKAAFLIGIIAISCIAMPAQKLDNDGLVLFGSVQSQKKSERDGKRIYQIIVRLLFRNDSNQTLIFLSPHIMTRKVEFLYQSLGRGLRPPDESERLVTTIVLPPTVQDSYPGDYDWIHSYAAKLDKSESPDQEAIVLQPGASKEFVDVLNIVQLYKLK